MSKKISVVLIIIALVSLLVFPVNKVFAANKEVLTMDASESGGKISVSGTVEDGMLAVAISVYDETGANLLKVETTNVESGNTFSYDITIPNGTYVVKAADYDEGPFLSKTVTVTNSTSDDTTSADSSSSEDAEKRNSSNINTGDNIMIFAAVFAMAIIALGITFVLKKKNKINKD